MQCRRICKQEAGDARSRAFSRRTVARLSCWLWRGMPLILLGCGVIVLFVPRQTAMAQQFSSPPNAAATDAMPSGAQDTLPREVSPLGGNWYGAAPYWNGDWDVSKVGLPAAKQAMQATGAKALTLNFILSSHGTCAASWDDSDPISSDAGVAQLIDNVRAEGGDVAVSFSSDHSTYPGKTDLAEACLTPQATAAAEQAVIDKFHLHAIDYDLEDPQIHREPTAIYIELAAAQILQKNNPGLYESITLPGGPDGVDSSGQYLLDSAKRLNYTPNNFSLMLFDGGFATDPTCQNATGGQSQITALKDFNAQLMQTFGWDSATAYAHEGIVSMDGRTDAGEYFCQKDFQAVEQWAVRNRLSRFSFWALVRDHECDLASGSTSSCQCPHTDNSLSSCSMVPQQYWEFTGIIVKFANAIAVPPICQFQSVPEPDPLTGLPGTAPSSTDQECTVPVPGCTAPTAGTPAVDDWLLGLGNGLLLSTRATDTYGTNLVQSLWGWAFGLAIALLAIPFALAGLQLIRGTSGWGRANVIELLGRIFFAACAAGLSFFAIKALIDMEGAFVQELHTVIPAPKVVVFMPSVYWPCNTQQFFGNIFNLSVYNAKLSALIADNNATDKQPFFDAISMTIGSLSSNMGNYLLTLLSVLLALQLAARLALLNAYIIVSPVTIICSVLGGRSGQEVTGAWIKGFMSLLLVQVLQLLALWLGSQLVPAALINGTDWMNEVLAKIIPMVILIMTLRIPALLQSPVTTLLTNITSSIGGAMTGVVLIIRGA